MRQIWDGQVVLREIEKWEKDHVRIVEVDGVTRVETQCYVCDCWKPICEMKYVYVGEWRFVPVCSDECYLALCLGKGE